MYYRLRFSLSRATVFKKKEREREGIAMRVSFSLSLLLSPKKRAHPFGKQAVF